MKTAFRLLLVTLFLSCSTFGFFMSKKPNLDFNRKESIKEYAICKCILQGLNSKDVNEKDNSTWGEGDICECDPRLLLKIDSLARTEGDRITPIQASGDSIRKPIILGCIEFAKSKKLDSLLKLYKIH